MNPDPFPGRGRPRGFTLVELMVAAVVGAVLLIGVLTVVRSGSDLSRSAWHSVQTQAEARAALHFLVEEWRARVPGMPVDFATEGDRWRSDRLGFYRAMTASERANDPDGGNVIFVSYGVAIPGEAGGSRCLVRTCWRSGESFEAAKLGKVPQTGGTGEVVAFQVAGFGVELFDRSGDGRLVPLSEGAAVFPEAGRVTLAVTDDATAARLGSEEDWDRLPVEAVHFSETRLDCDAR